MMNLVDMHCDTISKLIKAAPGQTLAENNLDVNIEGLEKSGTLAQFFACFVNAASFEDSNDTVKELRAPGRKPGEVSQSAWERAYLSVLEMAERTDREQNEKIKVACNYAGIMENKKRGVISAIKTVEEGGVISGQLSRLDDLYKSGIRLITLTWNHANCLGYPNSRDKAIMEKGLTEFGIQAVRRMNELGILVDTSHLSDGGFWDCIRTSTVPICASHSNARALCGHPRNLTDEMIRALGETGGAAGLNFFPPFLKEDGKAVLDDIALHAVHMIRTGGEDVAAVGTDLDGFENEVREQWVGHVRDMGLVWETMKRHGITERQLDKIMQGNALRVIKEGMK
ncbi:MAG: membrane dipeptidase [Muricomes sp.]